MVQQTKTLPESFQLVIAAAFVIATSAPAFGQPTEGPHHEEASPWSGRASAILTCLESGDITERKPIGRGVTKPEKVWLACKNGSTLKAVWKPLGNDLQSKHPESYVGEVVAFRLDQELGLDMVPPTAVRELAGRRGSIQFWVDGFKAWVDVATSGAYALSHRQMIRTRIFDKLINNPDRNQGNILVNQTSRIVLIDHSRALPQRKGTLTSVKPVREGDADMVERLQILSEGGLEKAIGDLLTERQIRQLLRRRDNLVKAVAGAS